MDAAVKINIPCPFCGHILATRLDGIVTVKGQPLPTEHVDGIILRCVCGRLKTYYLRAENATKKPSRKI